MGDDSEGSCDGYEYELYEEKAYEEHQREVEIMALEL